MKYLVLIWLFFLIPLVLAETIEDVTVNIKIHNKTIEIINSEYSGNNLNETFEIVNGSVVFKEFNFPIIFIKNDSETVDINIFDKYINCLSEKSICETEKGKWDAGWNACRRKLEKYENENATICQTDLDSCNLRVKEKDLTIGSKQDAIKTLEEEVEGKKNTKYIYLVMGLAIGYAICLYKEGKIGNPAKETAQGDFNNQQSG